MKKNYSNFLIKNIDSIERNFNKLKDKIFLDKINLAANILVRCIKKNNKILLCGNGGSASDSNHIAAEIIVRFLRNRKALPAISLATNNSVITAISNDISFNKIFSRQIEALGKRGDVLIALTTSGKSKNVLEALKEAKKKGMKIIFLTSQKCNQKINSDCVIKVPTTRVDRAQEMHIAIGHLLCELVENSI
jgi:D-sedoheptulose 7-phosphate isomerase